jgi:predicted AlkP superfamily phosphohydrolase/phosphomutase
LSHPASLVILGIDAGDPGLIEQWGADGSLPTIASLMERGSWGRTSGAELISEHGVWVSAYSGVSRIEHGYYYFRQLEPGTYDLRPVTGPELDAPPFWSLAGDRRVAIVDVPDAPLVHGLDGTQVLNWGSHTNWDPVRYRPASEPPDVLADVQQRFGEKLSAPEQHQSVPAEDREIYQRVLAHVRTKGAMCRHLLTGTSFDLVFAVFGETHGASHQFWQYAPWVADGSAPAAPDLTDAIKGVYTAVDRELGELLELFPAPTNVVVVSQCGMRDSYPTVGLTESFCRELGYQAAPDRPDGRSFRPADVARTILPERLRVALSSRMLSREAREGILAEQFRRATDWERTTAFAIPSSYTGMIRVNLRGREPQGIVEPGRAYEELLDSLENDLRQLVDPHTGESVVLDVLRTTTVFGCEAPMALPDVFVDWLPGRYLECVRHPRAEIVQRRPDFFRRSDHSREGFVAAAGPSIRALGGPAEVDVLDLAPTFLALLGITPPDRLKGRVLTQLLAP